MTNDPQGSRTHKMFCFNILGNPRDTLVAIAVEK